MQFLIPEGAVAGDLLQVEPDTGETVEVTVPRGMQAGMTMTVADLGSGWQPVTDRLGEVLQSGGDLEMSLLSHAEMDSILQPLPPQPLQSGLSEELLAVPNNSAIPGKSDRSAWRTLTQLGGGEVMKLRRWPERRAVSEVRGGSATGFWQGSTASFLIFLYVLEREHFLIFLHCD